MRWPATLALTFVLAALPAWGQGRTAGVVCPVGAAAELNSGGQVIAAPGATTTLVFSYRASKHAGQVVITVRAVGNQMAPVELTVRGAISPIMVTPGGAAALVWSAGAGTHGLRRTLTVANASSRAVELVYSIVAS